MGHLEHEQRRAVTADGPRQPPSPHLRAHVLRCQVQPLLAQLGQVGLRWRDVMGRRWIMADGPQTAESGRPVRATALYGALAKRGATMPEAR
jgi:hypothetical protein